MKYRCRGNNDCDITANNHSMCRACRYSKCLSMGMNVSNRPKNIRKPMSTPKKINLDQPGTTSLLLEALPPNFSDQVPILNKMKENYQKMVNARLVVHKDEGAPRVLNYLESVEQGMKDVGLVADWISGCFEVFVILPMEQKNILFRNFYPKFCLLEATFMSHIRHAPDKITLPSGDNIDMNNLDTFYYDPEKDTQMTKEEIERSGGFKPASTEVNFSPDKYRPHAA
ncbi:hypothetical protein GCK72_004513 [Caenorhabditis remanei]|uniref:Nuclear receptor domain-containing protein n=1 Tax=Caenorhabditis remanei TaxID=31234 RepID=A0A6A5HCI7_CAERE|nr:hypothetical protein GCK72_004513 [Caenorhabditis remanei]KAF1764564.1 hypothetical protein GCK72_004513 [Caenorhabditis remanei]